MKTANTDNHDGFFGRVAKFTARNAKLQLSVLLAGALALSVIALMDFDASVDNDGWISRGTKIADRSTQYWIVNENAAALSSNSMTDTEKEDLWSKLLSEPQPNFSDDPTEDNDSPDERAETRRHRRLLDNSIRQMQEGEKDDYCYNELVDSYDFLIDDYHLAPVWKVNDGSKSALDPDVLQEICESEQNTMKVLEREGHCIEATSSTCMSRSIDGDRMTNCLPAVSLVWFVRVQVQDVALSMSCSELVQAWSEIKDDTTQALVTCVEDIRASLGDGNNDLPSSCPEGFAKTMVDENFSSSNTRVGYTASIFPTLWDEDSAEDLYALVDEFDNGDGVDQNDDNALVVGAYDNRRESLGTYMTDLAVTSDMILAMGSGAITTVAILLHTQSPFVTFIGLLQIILSFPLSYFVYTFIISLSFFPFLNFIGVFVVFALGANDIFVAMDKWKNARLDYPHYTTEQIAAVALPDAADAMLLTTITTAVAFFIMAICKVAPLICFAIFCGLLITLDYILCLLLVFPALCIYDMKLQALRQELLNEQEQHPDLAASNVKGKRNACCSFGKVTLLQPRKDDGKEEKPSLIRRILSNYYAIFHKLRYIILLASLVATGFSLYYASNLTLPTDSTVRLLGEQVEYEQSFAWRNELLSTTLEREVGSPGALIWGVSPGDDGNKLDPKSGSTLMLDNDFDLSPEANQLYVQSFCNDFLNTSFAAPIYEGYTCPLDEFNSWLSTMNTIAMASEVGTSTEAMNYAENCNNASSLPVDPNDFHACISAWARDTESSSILIRNNEAKIVFLYYSGNVRFDSPFEDLDNEWNGIEDFTKSHRDTAETAADSDDTVKNMFIASIDFWWYDTNGSMLRSAFQSAGFVLCFCGFIVLLSSQSLVLTLFSMLTLAYVLASTTALLVASGWTLGFLESICFAILIGISCDFVLHFCHAYSHYDGGPGRYVDRGDRTKQALIRMGPSILASGVTTIGSATIMLFTVVLFFQQFAQILFFTVIQATVGSFVVFTALVDCFGPTHPTYWVDTYCRRRNSNEDYSNGEETVTEVVAITKNEVTSTTSSSLNSDDKAVTTEMNNYVEQQPGSFVDRRYDYDSDEFEFSC